MIRASCSGARTIGLLVLLGLVSGCGFFSSRGANDDGIPSRAPMELMNVAEPVPRWEPRSELGNHSPYKVFGKSYRVLKTSEGYSETGVASWYGTKFHGRKTSSGEPYDVYKISAAHKTLPLPTYVKVTNLENGRTLTVRVNDRGPFKSGRIIDLSYAAAVKLGVFPKGTARVRVEAIPVEKQSVFNRLFTSDSKTKSAPAANTGGGIFVQAGAFSSRSNAERLEQRLKGQQLGNTSTESADARGLFRVMLGPFETRGEAEFAKQRLLDSFGIRALIIQ